MSDINPKRRRRRRIITATLGIFILTSSLWLTCCHKGRYLAHVSVGEAKILLSREPINDVLASGGFNEEEREKIEAIREARQFTIDEMGFGRSGSYESFVRIDRQAVSYALVACPKLSLKPLTYKFPIAGEVSYLGFFSLKLAQEWEERLASDGYDTNIGHVAAFSTLGYFNDPVTSTMLKYRVSSLVNIIIHELAHSALYFKGHPKFNENSATFLGNEGAMAFLNKKYGPDSEQVQYAINLAHDEKVFGDFIKKVSGELEELYSGHLDEARKLEQKASLLESIKERSKNLPFKTGAYSSFSTMDLNNAIIYSHRLYNEDLTMFYKLHEFLGGDLKKTYQFLKTLEGKKGDPFEMVKKAISS